MNDKEYMKMAIDLAKSTTGQTSPNPVVGSVLVKNNQIIGLGAHLKAGEGHAEVNAINMAGEKAKDATIYVTLEPCSHYGKTPPCADLIINTGIKRVVIATTDPNPQVAGKGIAKLQNAGIEVELGVLQKEADALNTVFFHYIQTKRPFVTLKSAVSLDGKIATVTGESKWITGEAAREDVHVFRHQHDAILVGVNTVLKDNPSLTTRMNGGGKNPIRVILDTHLRTPIESKIVTDGEAPTWIVTGSKVSEERVQEFQRRGVEILKLQTDSIDINDLLTHLGERAVTSLYVEGGAEIHGSFVKEKAFDQFITYVAPKLIGGKNAPTSIGGPGFEGIDEALDLEIKEVSMVGKDIRIIAVPSRQRGGE